MLLENTYPLSPLTRLTLCHMHTMFLFPTRGYLFSSGGFMFSCALTPHSSIHGGEWHEPRMLLWHTQPGLGPPTDQTGSKKGYVRVPKVKLAEIPFAKNIRILVTKIQILKDLILSKTYQNCVQMYTWSLSLLKIIPEECVDPTQPSLCH